MKKIFFTLIAFFMFSVVTFAYNTETILGDIFELKYSAISDGHYFNEYIQPKETYNKWTKIFSVYEFPKNKTALESVKDLAQLARQQGATDAQYTTCPQNSGCQGLVIFTASNGSIKEFNVWKYKDYPNRIIANQYAVRFLVNQNISASQKQMIIKDFLKVPMKDVKNFKFDNPN